jgi:hypothetical protein
MKKLLFMVAMLVLTTVATYAQKTIKMYQPAYLINRESAERIAKEQQLNKKTVSVQVFMLDYPVLDSIENFNKKDKYSLINSALITSVIESNKTTTFILTNGVAYKVKKKNQINRIL